MKPRPDVALAAHNSLGAASTAEFCCVARHADAVVAAARWAADRDLPLTLLGGGSNVILRERVAGLVCLVRSRGIQWLEHGARPLLQIQAGESWHQLVRYTLGQGLAGLERLSLIPGCVGAAPMQNIGAYGSELADSFAQLQAFDQQRNKVVTLAAADCQFGYRDSLFKRAGTDRYLILSVSLRLQRAGAQSDDELPEYDDLTVELQRMGRPAALSSHPTIVAEAICRIRRRKLPDPHDIGNVGSVFKNPTVSAATAQRLRQSMPHLKTFNGATGVRLSAAQLIDLAGWKGHHRGAVGVWARQPLVLVQARSPVPASAGRFIDLVEDIRSDIATRFAVDLELEPRLIGRDAT